MRLESVMPWSGRLRELTLNGKYSIRMDVAPGVLFELAKTDALTGHGLLLEPGNLLSLHVNDCDGHPPIGFLCDETSIKPASSWCVWCGEPSPTKGCFCEPRKLTRHRMVESAAEAISIANNGNSLFYTGAKP